MLKVKRSTVGPKFNEVAGDRSNSFVKWGVRYIENFDITNLRGKDLNVRYIEALVNDCFVTQVTSVEIVQCQCLWHIISHWLKGCSLFTIKIKGFVDCWSAQCLSSVACWHCNSLYRGRFYVWGFRIMFVISKNSLYRGSLYRGPIPYTLL